MTNLDPRVLKRIETDSKGYDLCKSAYLIGSTAEATRAQKLADALKYISDWNDWQKQPNISRKADEALNEYFGTGDE